MHTVMVRYKVKSDRAQENERYIEEVFAELAARQPARLRYASFRLEDGVSFVHIASVETAGGENPLLQSTAFKAFVADIKDRCEEPPLAQDLHTVGAYRLFGA